VGEHTEAQLRAWAALAADEAEATLAQAGPTLAADVLDLRARLATEEAERIRCRDGWARTATTVDVLRAALREAQEALRLCRTDRGVKSADVRALGSRMGFGALMQAASAEWAAKLDAGREPAGSQYTTGPAEAHVRMVLETIQRALADADNEAYGAVEQAFAQAAALRHALTSLVVAARSCAVCGDGVIGGVVRCEEHASVEKAVDGMREDTGEPFEHDDLDEEVERAETLLNAVDAGRVLAERLEGARGVCVAARAYLAAAEAYGSACSDFAVGVASTDERSAALDAVRERVKAFKSAVEAWGE